VTNLADNTGEHISGENGNYGELTALYWMWKNKIMDRLNVVYAECRMRARNEP